MKYNELSTKDRASIIGMHVASGITKLSDIENSYNAFTDGGDTSNIPNVSNGFSLVPDSYNPKVIPAQTVQERQQAEYNKFKQTNPTFQQPVTKQTTSNKVGNYVQDMGSKALNALTTFGGSAVGDVINDISPKAANVVSKYTAGMITPTSQEYLDSNRSNDLTNNWNNRLNNSANAVSTQVGGELIGAGMNKAIPYIVNGTKNVGKEILNNSMPYLMGETKIPMTGYKPNTNLINNQTISDLFKSDSRFGEIGTPEQYLEHLNSIIPDVQSKDIVYHGTKNNFDNFLTRQVDDEIGVMNGAYFTKDQSYAKSYGPIIKKAILNTENPLNTEGRWTGIINDNTKQKILDNGYDSIINSKFDNSKFNNFLYKLKLSKPRDESIVFNKNQIYELGSTTDLERFKSSK